MTDDKSTLNRLRSELDDWRARLDHARVQVNLGSKEARDKLHDMEKQLSPAFTKAKSRLDTLVEGGTSEARTLGKSLLAGWEELRRTHRDLAREHQLKRAEAEREKRS